MDHVSAVEVEVVPVVSPCLENTVVTELICSAGGEREHGVFGEELKCSPRLLHLLSVSVFSLL